MTKILVVEDNEEVRELLCRILSLEGYQVDKVASAAAGLEAIRSSTPALVVTDLLMPDRDGLELIMEIRRSRAGLPIVAVSAGGRIGASTYLRMAEKLGADRVLTKPFQPEDLLGMVRELLE